MAYHPKYEKKFSTPFEHGLELFGGKWSSRIIGILHLKEPLRYSDFKDLLPGLTDPVLSNNLKKLIREEIIVRTQYDEIPPRVEYRLTTKGWELVYLCQQICSWCCKYYPREPENELPYCRNCEVNPLPDEMQTSETDNTDRNYE